MARIRLLTCAFAAPLPANSETPARPRPDHPVGRCSQPSRTCDDEPPLRAKEAPPGRDLRIEVPLPREMPLARVPCEQRRPASALLVEELGLNGPRHAPLLELDGAFVNLDVGAGSHPAPTVDVEAVGKLHGLGAMRVAIDDRVEPPAQDLGRRPGEREGLLSLATRSAQPSIQ